MMRSISVGNVDAWIMLWCGVVLCGIVRRFATLNGACVTFALVGSLEV